jgi:thiosulfate reductase cytochrome b subunit
MSDIASWPAVAAVAAFLLTAVLITFVATRPGGKFRIKILGRLFEIEHDGKRDNPKDQLGDGKH